MAQKLYICLWISVKICWNYLSVRYWARLYRAIYFCGLFYDAISITSNGTMIDEWWIVTDLKGNGLGLTEVLSWNLPGSTEKDREEPQSGTLVLRSWFKPSTSGIRVKTITATLTRSVLYIFVSNGVNTGWWFMDSSSPSCDFRIAHYHTSALEPPDFLPSCPNRCGLDVSERGSGFIYISSSS
jgi:hypothetical protein